MRTGCRFEVYRVAMNHLAKIRIGNTDDGLKYGGPESKDLYFQFVFRKEEDAEKFQDDILTIPQMYRKRFLNPSVGDISVEGCGDIEAIEFDGKLQRVLTKDYIHENGTDVSPDYDIYSDTRTSEVAISDESRLRLVDREDSGMFYKQNPEKCHIISQSKYPEDKKNPNNILIMSRYLHQQFDGIDSTEKCPLFYVKYLSHSESSSIGIVNGHQVPVYETTVAIIFCGEDDAQELVHYVKKGQSVTTTEYHISLWFQDPLEFQKFAAIRETDTLLLWNGQP